MSQKTPNIRIKARDLVRFVLELFMLFTCGLWGFIAWPFPWNLLTGVVTPLFAVLLWALFRSPKAVFGLDVFGKALVEVAAIGAVTVAWWTLGQPFLSVTFAVIAGISGFVTGMKEIS